MNQLRVNRKLVGALGCCGTLALVFAASAARAEFAPTATPAPEASSSAAPTPSAAPATPSAAPLGVPDAPEPSLHHAPVSVAVVHEPLALKATIDNPHLVRKAWAVYRTPTHPEPQIAIFQRASGGPYLATLPADQVGTPWIEYCLELESVDGKTFAVFASRETMFRVSVPDNLDDLRETALAQRLGGHRSLVQASGEFVYFGDTLATVRDAATNQLRQEPVADRYWRTEAGYTYRPLGIVSEFSIRAGAVRGQSVVPNETDKNKYQVGLNYASPMVRFRVTDALHVEAELLTSVTEVGFSMGGGGAILLGDPYGTRLTFGFESIETFGTRFFSKMDISAARGVIVAPVIEVTDMPHADRYGVRMLTDVQFDAGSGFRIGARGGYQARTFTSGGPTFGTSVSYAF